MKGVRGVSGSGTSYFVWAALAAVSVLASFGLAGFVLSLAYTGTCDGQSVCSLIRAIQTGGGNGTGVVNNLINLIGAPVIFPNASNPSNIYDRTTASFEFTTMYKSSVTVTGSGIILQSSDTTNTTVMPGQFNGPGIGNKIFVGLRQGCNRPLTTLQSMFVSIYGRRGTTPNVYFNIIVDVDGDGIYNMTGNDCTVVVDSENEPDFFLPPNGAVTNVTVLRTDRVFRSRFSKCGLSNSGSNPGTLANVTDAFPDARIYCGDIGMPGFPLHTNMAGLLYVQIDSATRTFAESGLQDFSVVFS